MARDLGLQFEFQPPEDQNESQEKNKSSIGRVLFKTESFQTANTSIKGLKPDHELGPLERKTKQQLCNRALVDYSNVDRFTWEKFTQMDIDEEKAKEKEPLAIRVARSYKSKEF